MEVSYNFSPELIMVVGLPGSGKSIFIKNHVDKKFKVHSSDAIREELSGDINNQDINAKVFETLHKRIKEDLKNNISCVYDATNISWKRRKAFLQSLNGINCYKTCIVIATPYEKCLEQNSSRDRVVPEDVIKRMYMNFDIPFYNEGWNNIEVYYGKPEYKSVLGHWQQFILDNIEFNQNSKWHKETLGEHCRLCLEYVKEHDTEISAFILEELRIASALHDCGKPFTQTYKDCNGNDSEYAHYYNHECVGSYNSLFYSDMNNEYYDKIVVAALIRWHMILHFFKDWKPNTIAKYEKEFTSHEYLNEMQFYNALKLLHEGDKSAH